MKSKASDSMSGKGVTVAIMDGAMLQSAAEDAIKKYGDNETNAANEFMEKVIAMGGPAAELIRWGEDEHGFFLCLEYIRKKNYRGEPLKPTVGRKVESAAVDGGGHGRSETQRSHVAAVKHHGQKNASPAYIAVAKKASKSLYDTFKTSDGRAWGDVGAHELYAYRRDGNAADEFIKIVEPKLAAAKDSEKTKPLRELMNAAEFKACIERIKGKKED